MQNLPLACFCGFGHCACKRIAVIYSKPPQAQRPKPPHSDRLCLLLSGSAFTPPQHAASRWPPLRGLFSRVACPASPHTRKRRPGVTLTGWRWCQGSAFPAFRKVGEYQWWLLVQAVSASGVVASGSIPRPALLSGARFGRYAKCAASAAKRKKRVGQGVSAALSRHTPCLSVFKRVPYKCRPTGWPDGSALDGVAGDKNG